MRFNLTILHKLLQLFAQSGVGKKRKPARLKKVLFYTVEEKWSTKIPRTSEV